MDDMCPSTNDPEEYPEAQNRRAAQKQPKDNMQLHKREPAPALPGTETKHQHHTQVSADDALKMAESVQRSMHKSCKTRQSRSALSEPDEQLRFYPSVTAPRSRKGFKMEFARNSWTDEVKNYPPEMLGPNGATKVCWKGPQVAGVERPTPRRWRMDPDEAKELADSAPQPTDTHSGPAPLCEHYQLVKAGKAAGQGSQIGKLHWGRPKVTDTNIQQLSKCLARSPKSLREWGSGQPPLGYPHILAHRLRSDGLLVQCNNGSVSKLWDERLRGMTHPETDILSAAEVKIKVCVRDGTSLIVTSGEEAGRTHGSEGGGRG